VAQGVAKRHLQLSWAGTNRHPGIGKLLRFLFHVLKRQTTRKAITPKAPDDDSAVTRVATIEILSKYQEKIVRCTSPAEVAKFKAEFLNNDANK
jgi:hypothetical protein